jgi:hypothetical protein
MFFRLLFLMGIEGVIVQLEGKTAAASGIVRGYLWTIS